MINIKVLIIGYGSIGRRHHSILSKFKKIKEIKIVTRLKVPSKFKLDFKKSKLIDYNPDYIIVSSETSTHYKYLKKINILFKNKIILIEKPIFHSSSLNLKNINNKIFVGYNLRFHPLLSYLKNFINKRKDNLLSINIYSGSFLPKWRDNQKYFKSYSAHKNRGGGVENDLSHEFDYVYWLFGGFKTTQIINKKISSLKISSNDHLTLIGKINKKVILNITLNYYSKISYRKMIIDFDKKSIHLDLINNKLLVKFVKSNKNISKNLKNYERNFSYKKQHEAILSKNYDNLCTIKDAMQYINITK